MHQAANGQHSEGIPVLEAPGRLYFFHRDRLLRAYRDTQLAAQAFGRIRHHYSIFIGIEHIRRADIHTLTALVTLFIINLRQEHTGYTFFSRCAVGPDHHSSQPRSLHALFNDRCQEQRCRPPTCSGARSGPKSIAHALTPPARTLQRSCNHRRLLSRERKNSQ